jgi:hypothetical protein
MASWWRQKKPALRRSGDAPKEKIMKITLQRGAGMQARVTALGAAPVSALAIPEHAGPPVKTFTSPEEKPQ